MFEQSTLPRASGVKRFWTTTLGMTGQAVLVGCMLLAPMLWPQILPKATVVGLVAPPGPPPPPAPKGTVRPRHTAAVVRPFRVAGVVAPSFIPPVIRTDPDPPPVEEPGYGVPGAVPSVGAPRDGVPGGILGDLMRQGTPPPHVEPAPRKAPEPAATLAPKRIHVSQMQMARLIHRVEPVYPPLAKSARIAGSVHLEGVIGTDGRLRELRVLSGHPFLSKAALDAVSQWVYEPTILNGSAVEVVAPITVTFVLN